MLGFTSSGCFIMGIIIGFILAVLVAVAALFYFKPDIKAQVLTHVEEQWSSVKNSIDNSIDAVKKAPVAEPALAVPRKVQPETHKPAAVPVTGKPQAANKVPKSKEIKLTR